jgi:hypothetical protein
VGIVAGGNSIVISFMESLITDEELTINYFSMVFGESRSRMYEVGGTQKQLDEYLLCARRKHFRSKAYKSISLRVSTVFDNVQDNGVHLYFHAADLPFHFAIHLGHTKAHKKAVKPVSDGVPVAKPKPNVEQELLQKPPQSKFNAEEKWTKDKWTKDKWTSSQGNRFHFTFDNYIIKLFFQEETGRPWCLDDVMEWDQGCSALCYKEGMLDTMENVYLRYCYDLLDVMDFEIERKATEKLTQVHMRKNFRKFTSEFLAMINGLAAITTEDPYKAMLGNATFIPPHTRPIEFLYSLRSIGAVQFVKFNNEGVLDLVSQKGSSQKDST